MLITEVEIQVACAVILRGQEIVLSRRSKDSHQGGLWEFPGGKIEPGESPEACLTRELSEELDIVPTSVRYMFQITWDYGDKSVRLWVFEVLNFDGEPRGCEGQLVQWFHRKELNYLQFPDANKPIIRTIYLPRYLRIFSAELHLDPVSWIARAQTRSLLYFRNIPPSNYLIDAIDNALECSHAVILTVDQLACFRPGVGIHLRKSDSALELAARIKTLRNPWPLTCGIRTLNEEQKLDKWPFDAAMISPIAKTFSHPNMQPLGWERFEQISSRVNRPVFALGGLSPNDLSKALKHLGFGVAGIRNF